MYDTTRKIIENAVRTGYTHQVALVFDGTGSGEEGTTDFVRGFLDSISQVSGTIGSVSTETHVGLYVYDIFTKKNKGLATANSCAQSLTDLLYLKHFSRDGVSLEVQKVRFSRVPADKSSFNHHQLVFTLQIHKNFTRPL